MDSETDCLIFYEMAVQRVGCSDKINVINGRTVSFTPSKFGILYRI